MSETYNVVLLVEQALTAADAAQVRSLHDEIEETVTYHVLLPLEDAAARIESAMGSLSAGEVLASPAMAMSDVDLEAVRRDCQERSDSDLERTLTALRAAGATVVGVTGSAGKTATSVDDITLTAEGPRSTRIDYQLPLAEAAMGIDLELMTAPLEAVQ